MRVTGMKLSGKRIDSMFNTKFKIFCVNSLTSTVRFGHQPFCYPPTQTLVRHAFLPNEGLCVTEELKECLRGRVPFCFAQIMVCDC